MDRGAIVHSDVTFLLVDKDTGAPRYLNGQDFDNGILVMSPSQCGPLKLIWMNEHVLKIICQDCGEALESLGDHASIVGPIQILYEGFPEKYSSLPNP